MKNSRTPKNRATAFLKCCTDLAAAKDGVVLVTFALSLLTLVLAVGLTIDVGRAYLVQQRLINTTDAAGLAVGSAVDANSTASSLNSVLSNFFTANFPSGGVGTVTSTGILCDGTSCAVSTPATSSTFTITAEVSVETTFMKIANINTLTVNATSVITRQEDSLEVVLVLDNTKSMDSSGKLTSLKTAALSLVDILFGSDTTSLQVKIALVPFAATVNIGTSDPSLVTNPTGWNGCVKALAGPDDGLDNSLGPWEPRPPATGGTTLAIVGQGCPQVITPLTNVKATLTTGINSMFATGITHINNGAVWGWRTISNNSPFTDGANYGVADLTKAMIILTDGDNRFINSFDLDDTSAYQDYAAGEPSEPELDAKTATVCTAIKATGIIVYTITFQLSDPTTQALFQACATDADKYYNSPDAAELSRAFRAIAAQLKQLHVSS